MKIGQDIRDFVGFIGFVCGILTLILTFDSIPPTNIPPIWPISLFIGWFICFLVWVDAFEIKKETDLREESARRVKLAMF